jgi:hypothetical protein
MADIDGTDWSDAEIDVIVADYFEMLAADLSGKPYVKAHHNAALQDLIGRRRGAIEFKHQNISAVLLRLGLPWIAGYKPMPNFQTALINGVGRWLTDKPDWSCSLTASREGALSDATQLWVGPPPSPETSPQTAEPAALTRLVRKFDPATRDARNRTLGKAGEERVLKHEIASLQAQGRRDLAKRVRWVAAEDGDGAGYDILSFNLDGSDRLLEVKTTNGWERTPFHITRNECAVASERPDAFRVFRLYDFAKQPRAFEIAPPLEAALCFTPQTFLASLR